jgi:hypothetical protein
MYSYSIFNFLLHFRFLFFETEILDYQIDQTDLTQ